MSVPGKGLAAFVISLSGMMIGTQAFICYVPWREPPVWVPYSQLVCGLLFIVIGGVIGVRALFLKVGWDWGLALFTVVGDVFLLTSFVLLLCGVLR